MKNASCKNNGTDSLQMETKVGRRCLPYLIRCSSPHSMQSHPKNSWQGHICAAYDHVVVPFCTTVQPGQHWEDSGALFWSDWMLTNQSRGERDWSGVCWSTDAAINCWLLVLLSGMHIVEAWICAILIHSRWLNTWGYLLACRTCDLQEAPPTRLSLTVLVRMLWQPFLFSHMTQI